VGDPQPQSFVVRNEFLIRRLHSLSGLIPVGAYLVIHLLTNASILDDAGTFQRAVYTIHSLNSVLWVVEWVFIFLPLIFHAVVGFWIIAGGVPNTGSYPYKTNFGYTLQRATGMIAAVFILWHVFQMHGWFHNKLWLDNVATPLGGHVFRPYNAASTLGMAMQGTAAMLFIVLYAIGVLSCVYHLAYGLWTMGITWGVWITPQAQKNAGRVCTAFGVGLALIGLAALYGAATVDVEHAREVEQRMYKYGVESGQVKADEHKLYHPPESDDRAAADEKTE
jgi:succinate dehydrogenase / fumarate reductase cytochrome b subunit